jgi:hypothetical protein
MKWKWNYINNRYTRHVEIGKIAFGYKRRMLPHHLDGTYVMITPFLKSQR